MLKVTNNGIYLDLTLNFKLLSFPYSGKYHYWTRNVANSGEKWRKECLEITISSLYPAMRKILCKDNQITACNQYENNEPQKL